MAGLTLLGLGPGDPKHLTREAWEVLSQADEVFLRTAQHPTVAGFPPGVTVRAFDHLYEQADTFEEVYEAIVAEVFRLAQRPQGVVYAVPGHPLVAEATGTALLQRAREANLEVRVVEGLSFLEPVFRALGRDPFPHTALVDALELVARHTPTFPPSAPALIAQLYSREVAGELKLTLMANYPDEHPVILVHGAGTSEEVVEQVPLYAVDRSERIGLLTALYVPPLAPEASFEAFHEVIARLRAPDGCPWDRKQTHQSLRKYLLEETYEALEAIDNEDWDALKEELGDVLLQVVLHSQIAWEEGEFTLPEVLATVTRKIIRRHPHVFGEVQVNGVEDVLRNWEALKAEEKAAKGEQPPESVLDGIPKGLPALMQAESLQKKAAKVGFDWPDVRGVWDKVMEELDEVRQANSPEARAAEIGDLLFAVVNLARWYGVRPEDALREANARFKRRFQAVERRAKAQGRPLQEMSLEEMDALWEAVKGEE